MANSIGIAFSPDFNYSQVKNIPGADVYFELTMSYPRTQALDMPTPHKGGRRLNAKNPPAKGRDSIEVITKRIEKAHLGITLS